MSLDAILRHLNQACCWRQTIYETGVRCRHKQGIPSLIQNKNQKEQIFILNRINAVNSHYWRLNWLNLHTHTYTRTNNHTCVRDYLIIRTYLKPINSVTNGAYRKTKQATGHHGDMSNNLRVCQWDGQKQAAGTDEQRKDDDNDDDGDGRAWRRMDGWTAEHTI